MKSLFEQNGGTYKTAQSRGRIDEINVNPSKPLALSIQILYNK